MGFIPSEFKKDEVTYDFILLERFLFNLLPGCTLGEMVGVLKTRTYWWPLLARNIKRRIMSLLVNGRIIYHQGQVFSKKRSVKWGGLKKLTSIFHHCDGILLSLYAAHFDHFFEFKECDLMMKSLVSSFISDSEYEIKFKAFRKEFRKGYLSQNVDDCIYVKRRGDSITPKRGEMPPALLHKYYTCDLLDRSKKSISIVAYLSQTRATGLPTSQVVKKSLTKFKATVSLESEEPNPEGMRMIQDSLKDILSFSTIPWDVAFNRAKVSVKNSAKYESKRKDGGAFSFVQSLDKKPVKKVDLKLGTLTDVDVTVDTLGEWIFHSSLNRFLENPEALSHCRVSTVKEPGPKARIITVPSFYHSSILLPLHKAMTEFLKGIEEVSSGLSHERCGWQFLRRIDKTNPKYSWIYDDKVELSFWASDFEEATDYCPHWLVRAIIDELTSIFNIPLWYANVCKQLLTDMGGIGRSLHFPDNTCIIKKRGSLMGDPLTKIILVLIPLICNHKMRLTSAFSSVGDDIAYICLRNSSNFVNFVLNVETLGMKVSILDTYESHDWIHFCEEYILLPYSRYNCTSYCRKTGQYGYLPYLDYCRIRLILNPRSSQEDDKFSLAPEGKVYSLARDVAMSNGWERDIMFFLSIIQDVYLELHREKYFPYLPTVLGGLGKVPPYHNIGTFMNFLAKSKVSKTFRCYLSTVFNCSSVPMVKRISSYVFLRVFHRRNKHTPGETRLGLIHETLDRPDLDKFLVIRTADDVHPNVYSRLREVYISETQVFASILSLQRVLDLIFYEVEEGVDIPLLVENLEEGFHNLDPSIKVDIPIEEFPTNKIKLFWDVYLANRYAFHEMLFERLYDESVIDHIHQKYGFNVTIPVAPTISRAAFLSDELSDEKLLIKQWFESDGPKDLHNLRTTIISDDEIIQTLSKQTDCDVVIVATDDNKLCRSLAHTNIRIPMLNWIQALQLGKDEEDWIVLVKKLYPFYKKFEILVDMGSFLAFEEKHYIDGMLSHDVLEDTDDVFTIKSVSLEDFQVIPKGWPGAYITFMGGYKSY